MKTTSLWIPNGITWILHEMNISQSFFYINISTISFLRFRYLSISCSRFIDLTIVFLNIFGSSKILNLRMEQKIEKF